MVRKSLKDERKSIILFAVVFIMYSLIYMTKNCYSAAMASIVNQGIMTKTETGLITAAFSLVYAPFQILGGLAADRYSPHKLIVWGTLGASLCNLLVFFFSHNYVAMLIIWSLNAVIQFGIWPSIFKIITSQLKESHRVKAVFYIMLAQTIGLIFSYVCAAVITDWKFNFMLSAIILFLCVALFWPCYVNMEKYMLPDEDPDVVYKDPKKQKHEKEKGLSKLILRSGVPILLLIYAIQGLLCIGLKALAPVMLMENYDGISPSIANILNVILIVASSVGLFFSKLPVFKKFSEVTSITIMFAISVPLLVVVTFIGHVNIALIIAVLALLMVSVSSMTIFFQYITKAFEKFGHSGTFAGLFNCMSSIGVVLANYVFAKLADTYGWGFTTKSWLIIAIVSLILMAITIPMWIRFKKKTDIQ